MRFSLARLLAFIVCSSLLLTLARWQPFVATLITPAVVGPLVATAVIKSKRAAVVGLLSAYFWSIVLAVPVPMPAIYLLRHVDVGPTTIAPIFAILTSTLGGFLGARVELNRCRFEAQRRGADS